VVVEGSGNPPLDDDDDEALRAEEEEDTITYRTRRGMVRMNDISVSHTFLLTP